VHTRASVCRKWLAALAISLAVGGCSDDDIAFENQDPFNPPADSAAGFLGYYTRADQQTTCGNCHASFQTGWLETAHADAWMGLQSSGGAQESCEGCHTVSELGNMVVGPAGWNAVKDSSYLDVQCESCHGPGNDHIGDPAALQPLASIAVDTGLTYGCGECHEDTHHPFVEQWRASRHANVGFATGREGCSDCHGGKQALAVQFQETANYLEKDEDVDIPITCPVCHDPHGGPFAHQLRAPINVGSKNHLCILCHNRVTVPGEGTRGPHAAQGPLVLGQTVAWWPDGFEWLEGLTSSHGDTDVNPELCATCHVSMFPITDAATGDFVFNSVGHTFEAIPCTDAQGIPVPGPCTDNQRTFEACAGCHGSGANARLIYQGFKDTLNALLDQIWVDTDGNGILDAAPTDAGVLPLILQATGDDKQIDRSDTLFTSAEGILFNAQIAYTDEREHFADGATIVGGDTVSFSAHPTSGNGVHNPPFLEASILHAIDFYGIPAPAPGAVDLTIRASRSEYKR
jgi:predicted CXXCH cytochrome family protein